MKNTLPSINMKNILPFINMKNTLPSFAGLFGDISNPEALHIKILKFLF